jgi:transglutaminase-like putative cysteine protease
VFTGKFALVSVYGAPRSSGGTGCWITFDITGATTMEATDSYAIQNHVTDTDSWRSGATFGVDLNEGLNTFTMKYRVSVSGVGHYSSRRLVVVPF